MKYIVSDLSQGNRPDMWEATITRDDGCSAHVIVALRGRTCCLRTPGGQEILVPAAQAEPMMLSLEEAIETWLERVWDK